MKYSCNKQQWYLNSFLLGVKLLVSVGKEMPISRIVVAVPNATVVLLN
jgi:hypothetical protein